MAEIDLHEHGGSPSSPSPLERAQLAEHHLEELHQRLRQQGESLENYLERLQHLHDADYQKVMKLAHELGKTLDC